ncbi:hypothetical protein GQ457_14G012550 [Hibiscus cannabinus]
MSNDWHNLLKVPSNRLPETGSRLSNVLNLLEDKQRLEFGGVITHQKEGGRIVKVKDLKPKRIKDYLEYKFSQMSPALLKELNSRNEVNTVHVRDQKHELTPPRNRYPCDNGYKEVTVLPSRDIVYDQVKQLIGLRHKPITLQNALPRSDSQPRFSAKARPVVSVRDIPFVILLKQNIEALS